ncbi:MAG TPA: hypothetical protein VGK95_10750 [Caldimonas sp.]
MNSTTYALSLAPTAGVSGALHRIVAGAHWLRIAYAEQRRAARARAELLSYDAEARSIAQKTRLRVLDARGRWRSS